MNDNAKRRRGVQVSFENFGLSPELMNGLADTNLNEPTPLQQQVIPAAIEGKHLLVKNETEDEGAFLIPALHTLTTNGEVSGTRILILTPSIERAKKIDELVWAMGYHAQISPADLSMKGDKKAQEEAVLNGAPVIVANPGRLIDILEKTKHAFKSLATIVIDEAQGMDNFNLVSRVKSVLKYVEGSPQVLVFASAMNQATQELAGFALKDPERIGFEADESVQPAPVRDARDPKEKLKEATVKVVLNPESKKESADKEASEEVHQEAGNSVTESPEESETEQASEEVQSDPKEKLKEASVKVVLNPELKAEKKEEDHTEASSEEAKAEKGSQNQSANPEKKLKDASVKVVLKKDQTEEKEESISKDSGKEELSVPKGLEQGYIHVPPRMKISTLMAHLESEPIQKVIVFAASKRTTDRLFRIILKKNWGVVSINEGIDQETFDERFAKFTSGEMKILLVGGMAAKEIDINEVQQVINYDVPSEVDEYRYRAELVGNGKAARMVSLVSKMDREDIDKIVEEVGYAPEEIKLPEEVKEKKKKKTGGSKKSGKSKGQDKSKKEDRSGNRNNGRSQKKPKQPKKKEKQKGAYGLPRPTYDGLSGGREGGNKQKDTGGVFGWVKKLFD